jgi:hypothetical protein
MLGAYPLGSQPLASQGAVAAAPDAGDDVAPRYARPASDIGAGNWLPSSGADLYAMLDEATPDDSDYIYTTTAGACEIALGAVEDPETSSGQAVRYQVWSIDGAGVTVRLK